MVKYGFFQCQDCGDWISSREDEFDRRGECCEACFFVKTLSLSDLNLSRVKYKY